MIFAKLRVRNAAGNQKGVFAAENIENGKKILDFPGKIVPEEKSNPLDLQISKNTVIRASSKNQIDNFLNHSCDPTACVKKKGKIFYLISIKNIKKGDEIEIVEKDDKLFLYLQTGNISENPFKKGVLDVSKTGVLTRRSFDAMYKAGYDEIEVIYTHPEQLKDVKTAIDNEAMAFEIVRQEKNKRQIKSFAGISFWGKGL